MKNGPGKLLTIRSVIRFGIAAFIAFVTLRHRFPAGDVETASAEAYCAFGGFETLYKFVTTGSFVNHGHLSNLVIFVAALTVALIFRSAFCGWICPFGTIQDWFGTLGMKLFPRRDPSRSSLFLRLDGPARYAKYAVLALIIWGTVETGRMAFRDYDPYIALLEFGDAFTVATAILVFSLGLSMFVRRSWCRYACPLGAILGLAGLLSPFRIRRGPACTSCGVCRRECPMGIDILKNRQVTCPECNSCLSCLAACPREGAIGLTLPALRPVKEVTARAEN